MQEAVMRKTLLVMFLLYSSSSLAIIYHWVNQQGVQQYSQTPPRDKSIPSERVYIKKHIKDEDMPSESLEQSAETIAESNAERKTISDELNQKFQRLQIMAENCKLAKLSLVDLERGGNRLYKDANGDYQRLDEAAKNKQRKQLNAVIDENCQ